MLEFYIELNHLSFKSFHSIPILQMSIFKITDLKDAQIQNADEFLIKNLPFTVNMMDTIRRFPDRSDSYFLVEGNIIVAALTIFRSRYNTHIWNDPIIWVVGNAEESMQLVSLINLNKSILVSTNDLSGFIKNKYLKARSFSENIMVREKRPEDSTFKYKSQLLSTKFAEESLALSLHTTKGEENAKLMEREQRFLLERKCYGIIRDGKVVSRGAVMSSVKEYSSVGAFFTEERYRGQGYASDVIRAVLSEASNVSENTCLFVNEKNERAHSVYNKLGFSILEKVYFCEIGTGVTP